MISGRVLQLFLIHFVVVRILQRLCLTAKLEDVSKT
jgi:hypothetical protein